MNFFTNNRAETANNIAEYITSTTDIHQRYLIDPDRTKATIQFDLQKCRDQPELTTYQTKMDIDYLIDINKEKNLPILDFMIDIPLDDPTENTLFLHFGR